MVYTKMDTLSVEDVESGLLPFMMVAEGCDDVVDLSVVYELLCLNPEGGIGFIYLYVFLKHKDVYTCTQYSNSGNFFFIQSKPFFKTFILATKYLSIISSPFSFAHAIPLLAS